MAGSSSSDQQDSASKKASKGKRKLSDSGSSVSSKGSAAKKANKGKGPTKASTRSNSDNDNGSSTSSKHEPPRQVDEEEGPEKVSASSTKSRGKSRAKTLDGSDPDDDDGSESQGSTPSSHYSDYEFDEVAARNSRHDNDPTTWEPELPQFPQWGWESGNWEAARIYPSYTGMAPQRRLLNNYRVARAWENYVERVQTLPDDVQLEDLPNFTIPREAPHTVPNSEGNIVPNRVPFNGPFPVRYPSTVQTMNTEFPRDLGANGDARPTGAFWTARINARPQNLYPPTEAGVFVGFRNNGRTANNPWWWEVVYGTLGHNSLENRERLTLHSYQYNFIGMPLSRVNNHVWRCNINHLIPIRVPNSDHNTPMNTRNRLVSYIRERLLEERNRNENAFASQNPMTYGAAWHGHERNQLRRYFDQPPLRFCPDDEDIEEDVQDGDDDATYEPDEPSQEDDADDDRPDDNDPDAENPLKRHIWKNSPFQAAQGV